MAIVGFFHDEQVTSHIWSEIAFLCNSITCFSALMEQPALVLESRQPGGLALWLSNHGGQSCTLLLFQPSLQFLNTFLQSVALWSQRNTMSLALMFPILTFSSLLWHLYLCLSSCQVLLSFSLPVFSSFASPLFPLPDSSLGCFLLFCLQLFVSDQFSLFCYFSKIFLTLYVAHHVFPAYHPLQGTWKHRRAKQ